MKFGGKCPPSGIAGTENDLWRVVVVCVQGERRRRVLAPVVRIPYRNRGIHNKEQQADAPENPRGLGYGF